MAVSKAEKAAYNDEIKDIKRDVDHINKAINDAFGKKKKHPSEAKDPYSFYWRYWHD